MKKFRWKDYPALVLLALFYAAAAAVYVFAGEHAQIAVADNLDLFQSQYQMLRITGTFYEQDASALFLNGISRDVLPSEYSLTSLLYQIFEPLTAYELVYFAKITIAVISFALLAWELDRCGALAGPGGRRKASGCARFNLSVLCGLAYGILNLFPSYGICFASIPLLVWLVLRLEREKSRPRCALWLLGILFYPWLSYFSYFSFFLIAYLCGAFLFKTIRDSMCGKVNVRTGQKRGRGFHPDFRLLLSAAALSIGTVLCEYRLFSMMLFSDEVTIRETMVQSSLSAGQILQWIGDVLVNGIDMHCESMHRWLVLPVCVIYLILLNAGYVRRGQIRRAFTDVYNLSALTLLFNAVIYGLYYSEAVRTLVETILPPLTGFQFNRTAYFNPFLWYGMFFIAMYRLFLWRTGASCEMTETVNNETPAGTPRRRPDGALKGAAAADDGEEVSPGRNTGQGKVRMEGFLRLTPFLLSIAAVLVILLSDTTYNDLLHTAKADIKHVLGMDAGDDLDYAEFYSEDLFAKILEDIDYDGEEAVAYGLHPAILNYSGIATLDGYLGFYSQEYKEAFREVIAPALEENEATRVYYDDWGARCYIYSGHNTTVVEAVRNYTHTEDTIDIDTDALRGLGCTYIFSRIYITNAQEKGLTLLGTYTDEASPYTIYLYSLQ